jgi:hypothetical protein
MIGVLAKTEDHDVVREFFELFKTPWEFYRRDRRYDVVLATSDADVRDARARLVLVYAGAPLPIGPAVEGTAATPRRPSRVLTRRDGSRIPIYGAGRTFADGGDLLTDEGSGRAAATVVSSTNSVLVRIGYDLLGEIRTAFTVGQPAAQAGIPVVEAHIALMRDLVVEYAAPLIEIPPVPAGHPFIACLTHDVDHASIRLHRWDHTMFGFLYRAILGTLINVLRGRVPLRDLWINWLVVLKLPLVHLGLARDFWNAFDRYLEIDGAAASTFFVIPFRGRPGGTTAGSAPGRRASRYGASDIADQIRRLVSAGAHVGVHGIDAWRDSAKGREELDHVSKVTGDQELGVRMHWLYFDDASPALLEKAGFAFDSTSGYNETVGYRAGTTQVFKPLSAIRLLELPLHVMDTALFYASHLHLDHEAAADRMRSIVDATLRYGGVLTVNWHDRSIAPERLWGRFYRKLLDDLKGRNAWFATAPRAVAWFRARRSARIEVATDASGSPRARVSVDPAADLPGLRLRIHTRPGSDLASSSRYIDIPVGTGLDVPVPA